MGELKTGQVQVYTGDGGVEVVEGAGRAHVLAGEGDDEGIVGHGAGMIPLEHAPALRFADADDEIMGLGETDGIGVFGRAHVAVVVLHALAHEAVDGFGDSEVQQLALVHEPELVDVLERDGVEVVGAAMLGPEVDGHHAGLEAELQGVVLADVAQSDQCAGLAVGEGEVTAGAPSLVPSALGLHEAVVPRVLEEVAVLGPNGLQ